MIRFNVFIISSLFTLTSANLEAQDNPAVLAQLSFHDQGFSVEAPLEATQLELRLMGPARTVLFEQRSAGESIDWSLNGNQSDGDYRYEAIVVIDHNGTPQQHNHPGGFIVQDGRLVIPAEPASIDLENIDE
jgi:hypothetical protein